MSATSVDSFLEEHGDALGRLAYHLTGDREAALDLLQETFTRLMGRWQRVAQARHPLAYVRRAVLHQHLDAARRRVPTPRPTCEAGQGGKGQDPCTGEPELVAEVLVTVVE